MHSVLQEGDVWSNWIGFDVVMNGVWDGEATLQLYADSGSGFEPTGEEGTRTYDPGSAGEGGSWGEEVRYDFPADVTGIIKRPAKLVVTYKLKDGTTGSAESDTFNLYAGNYVVGSSVSYVRNRVIIDLEVDSSAASVADINVQDGYFGCGGTTLTKPTEVNKTGNHIYVIFDIGTGHEGESYWSYVELVYPEGGASWPSINSLSGNL
jgi:hypothetical protein